MQIAIFAYDHMTALDAVGPYEVLSRLPGAEVVVVGEQRGPVRCDTRSLALVADAALDDVTRPDVVVIPGWSGSSQCNLLHPGPVQDWLRAVDGHTTWTTAVGTGGIVLAAAGLLTGRRATTYWLTVDWLAELGAVPADERVVREGKYITAAGVSAGIDMGLALAARIAGEQTAKAIQLLVEYDPQPPFTCGSVATAPAEIVAPLRALRPFIVNGAPDRDDSNPKSEGSRPMANRAPYVDDEHMESTTADHTAQGGSMQIALALYPNFTMLDIIGPFQVLADVPGHEVVFVAAETGPVVDHTGRATLVATKTFTDVPAPDIVVVPGGLGDTEIQPELVEWLRAVHPTTTWTTSVCTGAVYLAVAGILDGLDATTHWARQRVLEQLGVRYSTERVVERGKVITAAGVSSGIDMGLVLLDRMYGPEVAQMIQLAIEYDPQPPFDAGSPAKAPAPLVDLVRERIGDGPALPATTGGSR